MKTTSLRLKFALVYGQMNEPPGARMRVWIDGTLQWPEYFRDINKQGRVCCLLITSFDLYRQDLKFQHC